MPDYLRMYYPGGIYFFTVVTCQRYPFFSDPEAVQILRQVWRQVKSEQEFEDLAVVMLPDHFHGLWRLPQGDSDFSSRIKKIKDLFTKIWLGDGGFEVQVSKSQLRRGHRGIWQRRFWEHLIRDESDLENHFDYIHFNPVKHGYVESPLKWPYSTFHRYVEMGHYSENWGRSCPDRIVGVEWD